MSTEENKAIVRRFFEEILNKGNMAVADELFAPNYRFHFPGAPEPTDSEGMKQTLTVFRTGFPDLHFTIEDLIAEGDKVAMRFAFRGTHNGEFQGIAPTGKQVSVTGIAVHRIVNGKIVEDRPALDQLGMLQQLGVIPPPG